jgi:F-type H+-transporting ATPase subunit b|uniref:ATP synthase subunit b, chloroplastic n=1 Tax=Vaucheria litorea TaxID=109269 RepID=ATPF_VAULI|nr:ATP synthase CF0 subunit I [Vaucheria litorea]B7T1R8.1 RecName: Full=ATP synthase subunit b, chloroplastic; AltName: Full=ATP synthase F(0) sector subunit b; AltName: Full=ATPase subunit I [Vaucheria litorea]ACF70884.1 ATP synthase CF0 subunit I [Vaucheria litorea]
MKNWISSFILVHQEKSISFNTNILETNLINIIILLIILFYFLKGLLKDNLSSRQENILSTIQNSENRINEANERLVDAKLQWSQAQITLEELKNQTLQNKLILFNAEFEIKNQVLSQHFNNLLMTLYYREQQAFNNIKKQVSELALKKVIAKLQAPLMEEDQSVIIINKIHRLGGNLE